MYSAFNLEEPLLCFVVNKYVLCSEKVTIVAIGLKFAMSVHTSFFSMIICIWMHGIHNSKKNANMKCIR